MGKIFLSHSSVDKPYVSYIAKKFGPDRCVYDAMCFEAGMKNMDEISREMDKTSLFVVFLSDASLNSQWVKEELSKARDSLENNSKTLRQIFPIIIDSNINHEDSRIPAFLKQGLDSYNLRFIISNNVAYRKILAQQTKLLMDEGILDSNPNCFYGRKEEIGRFQNWFDTEKESRCIIASGFNGIGRKSYMIEAMRNARIMKNYYNPPVVTMTSTSSIEDLIMRLSEIGFGECTLFSISEISKSEKAEILRDIFLKIQECREQVVIYDNGCLVDQQGNLAEWFWEPLGRTNNQITILIAATYVFRPRRDFPCKWVFSCLLSTLPYPEWSGLMRIYAEKKGILLTQEDKEYFNEVITGYPPQVLYCVDEMSEKSIRIVKKETHLLKAAFSQKATEILDSAIPDELKKDTYNFLAFACYYGIVPSDLIQEIIDEQPKYKNILKLLLNITACRYLGIDKEYIEVSPFICDYIQQRMMSVPEDIKTVIKRQNQELRKSIVSSGADIRDDFEKIRLYLVDSIISGKTLQGQVNQLMYSGIFWSATYRLYFHEKRYPMVITIIKKLWESGEFSRLDKRVQFQIQGIYCRSLARMNDNEFTNQVEYFNPMHNNWDELMSHEFHFLKGFKFRLEGRYDKALEQYKQVLSQHPRDRSTKGEIVSVYRGLEDYETAYDYAEENYLNNKEDTRQIQPFFETLIRKKERSEKENGYLNEMIETMWHLQQTKISPMYYELMGQYKAFVESNESEAMDFLNKGMRQFPNSSYIARSLFDCAEVFQNCNKMQEALAYMRSQRVTNKAINQAYEIRNLLYQAYSKERSLQYIEDSIDRISGWDSVAKKRLKRRMYNNMKKKKN